MAGREGYRWFERQGQCRNTENRDDHGACAPKGKLKEALRTLGLWPDRREECKQVGLLRKR